MSFINTSKAMPPSPPQKHAFSCYPNGIPPSLAWTWTGTLMDEHVMAGGCRIDVCPGMKAEVVDASGDRFNVYALGSTIQRGNMHAAESRLHREGGASNWCTQSGGTVSAPCVNKYQDGGDQVFIVMAHPVKKTYLKPDVYALKPVYADIAGVPVEFFTPEPRASEPPCTCENVNLPHSSDCPWKQWKDKK